nr:hypothetical protein [Tanacetum cinerariifolium]
MSNRQTLVTEEASTGPSAQPQDDTSTNVVCDTSSPADAEIEADTKNLTAGSNPGQSHVALARLNPEPMHKDFIATVYPKVYESLKHTTKEHVFLENPSSSSRTFSSMKNLDDAFTYGDQFLIDKPTEEELGKANVEIKVESMVTVPIHQSSLSVPHLSTPVIDLSPSKLELSEFEMKEILYDRMFESGSYRSQPKHTALYDALEASIDRENWEELIEATAKSRKRRRDDQDPHPPPPLKGSDQNKKKWNDSDTFTLKQSQAQTKTRDMRSFIKWYCKQIRKSKLSKADLEDQIDLVNHKGNQVVPDVSKPLPLGGPPGHVTIQPQYFFNKDLAYLISGDKERRNALLISKLKATYYPNFRLEELVPSLWIESEREYDISAAYVNLWIRNIVIRKYVEDLQLGIKSYQTKLNLTQPSWDASYFLFKEDYTIVHKPRVVIYRDRNNQRKMMRESKVHKFSDGTLTRI